MATRPDGSSAVRISIICEGKTEQAFKPQLIAFLKTRLAQQMPSLKFDPHHGAIPVENKLRRIVSNLLDTGKNRSDAVIALTDVYPAFNDADLMVSINACSELKAFVNTILTLCGADARSAETGNAGASPLEQL
jgi:ribosomal protein RSM22 (predicted rRNA methylase)